MNHNKPIEIVDNIFFIGAFDPDIRTFDIIMKQQMALLIMLI